MYMKTKAIYNLEAAAALIDKQDERYYTASIHHAYYAVFQYMKYVLANTGTSPLSYKEQDEKARSKGSHKYVIEQIVLRIALQMDTYKKARKFGQAVRKLKGERVEADYSTRLFTLEECQTCKQQAEDLIAKLVIYLETYERS